MWQSSAQLPGGTASVPSQPMWSRRSGSPLGSRSGHGVYFQPPGHGDSFKDGHRPRAGQPELTLELLLEGDKYPQWHLWGPVGGLRGPQHEEQWSQEMEKEETLETLSTWIQLCLKLVGFLSLTTQTLLTRVAGRAPRNHLRSRVSCLCRELPRFKAQPSAAGASFLPRLPPCHRQTAWERLTCPGMC